MNEIKRLSELAARILSELEEAGAENFSSTVNTVMDPLGEKAEIDDSVNALKELIQSGLAVLRVEYKSEKSPDVSFEMLSELESSVSFAPEERLWKWNEKLPMVEIVATEKGRELAFEILDERGYQWWRQNGGEKGGQ
jgi:hypothetical protein